MTALVTFVDTDPVVPDSRWVSLSARHEAILTNGHRVLLIDNRGWCHSGSPASWDQTTAQDIVTTARSVVGPLTPSDGLPHHDIDDQHWTHLAAILGDHDDPAHADHLRHLPHHVVLSPRLHARLGPAQTSRNQVPG